MYISYMPDKENKTGDYYAKDRKAWRKWLEKNHNKCTGVWLVYYKKDSGKTRVPYADAVEEALCFGWIDSTMRPIDEHSYKQLFAPRKPKSTWSQLNKDRVEALEKQGLMTDAGREKIEIARKNGSWGSIDHVETLEPTPELKKAFTTNKKAKAFFESLGKTNKKYILYYTTGVKSPELRAQRLAEVIAAANEGRMLDRFIGSKIKAARQAKNEGK